MKQDQFETKLERFVINHYLGISNTLAVVFLVGEVLSFLFGNAVVFGSFAIVMIGLTIVPMVLVGRPARKRYKAWKNNQARWEEKPQTRKVLIPSE